jgi:hypothetical protein
MQIAMATPHESLPGTAAEQGSRYGIVACSVKPVDFRGVDPVHPVKFFSVAIDDAWDRGKPALSVSTGRVLVRLQDRIGSGQR